MSIFAWLETKSGPLVPRKHVQLTLKVQQTVVFAASLGAGTVNQCKHAEGLGELVPLSMVRRFTFLFANQYMQNGLFQHL